MSTSATIAIKLKNNCYKHIICSCDGHLDNTGDCLFRFYRTKKKVSKLISQGDIAYLTGDLNENPSEGIYTCQSQTLASLALYTKNSWCSYLYVFIDNKWYYTKDFKHTVQSQLIPLTKENTSTI